jgi:sugar O-acyltransferase (sialic acid O-acetyltransferase NeuD family)
MTTRPLVIVGAGGFARETAELVRAVNERQPAWDLLGFLDDDPTLTGRVVSRLPVLGTSAWVHDHPHAAVVVCVGSPRNYMSRAIVVERLGLTHDRYPQLVHPAAVVPPSALLGAGTVVHATSVFTTDVQIGAHVAVMPGVILTHDDLVGDFVTFGAGVRVAGASTIDTGAYVGSGALIRESITVGAWSLIGMGSVVTRSVPAGQVWAGVPARFMRDVESPVANPPKTLEQSR